mgnify:CR=1 FL=1
MAQASQTIEVVRQAEGDTSGVGLPDVRVSPVPTGTKFSAGRDVTLNATLRRGSHAMGGIVHYSWFVQDASGAELRATDQEAILAGARTSLSATAFLPSEGSPVAVPLVLSDGLVVGASYRFTLAASFLSASDSADVLSTKRGYGYITLTMNEPPLEGSLSVTPSFGRALNTTFTLRAYGWIDDPSDYPLKYSFYALNAQNVPSLVRAEGQNPAASSTLSQGREIMDYRVNVSSIVTDAHGAASTTTTSVKVSPLLDAGGVQDLGVVKTLVSAALEAAAERSPEEVGAAIAAGSLTINLAACTGADDTKCAALKREPCSTTLYTCGPCLPGYMGAAGHHNFQCFSTAAVSAADTVYVSPDDSRRRLQAHGYTEPYPLDAPCARHDQCASGKCGAGRCSPTYKQCPGDCSGVRQGDCLAFDRLNKYIEPPQPARRDQNGCKSEDLSCRVRCVCAFGYYGGDCSLSKQDLDNKIYLRTQMCSLLLEQALNQAATPDTTAARARAVVDLAADSYQMTNTSVAQCADALLQTVRDDPFSAASQLPLVLDALSALLVPIDANGDGTAVGETPSVFTIDAVREAALSAAGASGAGLAPGQDPITCAASGLRVTTRMLPAVVEEHGGVVLEPPLSDVEKMMGVTTNVLPFVKVNVTAPGATVNDLSSAQPVAIAALYQNFDSRPGLTNSTPVQVVVQQFDNLVRHVALDVQLLNSLPIGYPTDKPQTGSLECLAQSQAHVELTLCNETSIVNCPGDYVEAFVDYTCPIRDIAPECVTAGTGIGSRNAPVGSQGVFFDSTVCARIAHGTHATTCRCQIPLGGLDGQSDALDVASRLLITRTSFEYATYPKREVVTDGSTLVLLLTLGVLAALSCGVSVVFDAIRAIAEVLRRQKMAKFAQAMALRNTSADRGGIGGLGGRGGRRGGPVVDPRRSKAGVAIPADALITTRKRGPSTVHNPAAFDDAGLEHDNDDSTGDRRVIEFNMRHNAGKLKPVTSGSIAVDRFFDGVLPLTLRFRRWFPRLVASLLDRHVYIRFVTTLLPSSHTRKELHTASYHVLGGYVVATQWVTATVAATRMTLRVLFIAAANLVLAVCWYPDDGMCEDIQTRQDCLHQSWPWQPTLSLSLSSSLAPPSHRLCAWQAGLNRCEFSGPDTSNVATVLAVCAAVLLTITPIMSMVDVAVATILAPVIAEPEVDPALAKKIKEKEKIKAILGMIPSPSTIRTSGGGKKRRSPINHDSIVSWERRSGEWQSVPATLLRAARLRKQQVVMDFPSAIEEVRVILNGIYLPTLDAETRHEDNGEKPKSIYSSRSLGMTSFVTDSHGELDHIHKYFEGQTATMRRLAWWFMNTCEWAGVGLLKQYNYPPPTREFLIDMVRLARVDAEELKRAIGARARLLHPSAVNPLHMSPEGGGGADEKASLSPEHAAYFRGFVQTVLLQQFIVQCFHRGPRQVLMRMLLPQPQSPHASAVMPATISITLFITVGLLSWACVLLSANIGSRAHEILVVFTLSSIALDGTALQIGSVFVHNVVAASFVVTDCIELLKSLQARMRLVLGRRAGAIELATGYVHHFNAVCRLSRSTPLTSLTVARMLMSLNDYELTWAPRYRNPYTPHAGPMNIAVFSILTVPMTLLGFLPDVLKSVVSDFIAALVVLSSIVTAYLWCTKSPSSAPATIIIVTAAIIVFWEWHERHTRVIRRRGRRAKTALRKDKTNGKGDASDPYEDYEEALSNLALKEDIPVSSFLARTGFPKGDPRRPVSPSVREQQARKKKYKSSRSPAMKKMGKGTNLWRASTAPIARVAPTVDKSGSMGGSGSVVSGSAYSKSAFSVSSFGAPDSVSAEHIDGNLMSAFETSYFAEPPIEGTDDDTTTRAGDVSSRDETDGSTQSSRFLSHQRGSLPPTLPFGHREGRVRQMGGGVGLMGPATLSLQAPSTAPSVPIGMLPPIGGHTLSQKSAADRYRQVYNPPSPLSPHKTYKSQGGETAARSGSGRHTRTLHRQLRDFTQIPSPVNPRGVPLLVEGSWEQSTVATLDAPQGAQPQHSGRPLTGNRSSRNKARREANAKRAKSPNQRGGVLPALERYNPLKTRDADALGLEGANSHQHSL